MKNNGESVLPPQSSTKEETLLNQYNSIKKENEKLLSENEALKENLQKEKFYHQNLYKQWNELNTSMIDKNRELDQLRSTQNPKLRVYQYAFYGLLLFSIVLAVFNFNSFTNGGNNNPGATQVLLKEKKVITPEDVNFSAQEQNLNTTSANKIPDKKELSKNTGKVNEAQLSIKAAAVLPVTNSAAKYLIKQKSYFHNKPVSNTQRKTFVLPGNDAYGILTALDDRNGFIYVVFINHAGRTSKGWISKSDLEPLK